MADRSVLVRIKGDASDLVRAAAAGKAAISGLRDEIDTTNDRTAWMAQGFLALGPALAPIGAAAVPALAGLATQMTVAGLAAGSLGLAFNGVFDAAKSLNEYQLEPTAENFTKLQQAMDQIGPAGEEFVRFLDSVGPQFTELQMAAREGMFPGMEEGITHILDLLPQLERIVGNVSEGIGQLSAEAGEGLAGEGFADFFDYLETDARPILVDMGHIFGNFAEGLAQMMVEFGPLTADFSTGFRDMSESFVDWAHGLDQNQSFQEFLAYAEDAGPKVLDLFGAMVDAFVQIAEAAAPVGDIMLPALEGLLDVVATLANTPLGSAFIAAAAAMSIYGRAAALASITTGGLGKSIVDAGRRTAGAASFRTLGTDLATVTRNAATAGAATERMGAASAQARSRLAATGAAAARAGGGIGVLALSMTDIDDKMGVANTAMGAMAGLMLGGPWGAAVGAGIGAIADFASRNDDAAAAADALAATLDQQTGAVTRNSEEWAKNALFESGAFDAAEKVGLSLDDLTQAALGNEAAIARVNAAHEAHRQALQASAEETGIFDSDLAHMGDDWFKIDQAIGGTRGTLADARTKIRQFGEAGSSAGRRAAQGFTVAATAAEDFSDAVERVNALLERRSSLRDYEAAVDDLVGTLRGVRHMTRLVNKDGTINIDLPKGREVQAALDEIASTAIRVSENMRGTQKVQVLNQARHDLIETARKFGLPRAAVQVLLDKLRELSGTQARAQVIVETSRADAAIADVRSDLAGIQDEEVWVTVRRRGTGLGAVGGSADGGTIPGARQPYGDKALYMLAPGEEVISNRNGQADYWRPLLKAINAGGLADGGTVGRIATMARASSPNVSVGGPSVSLSGMQITAVFDGVERVIGRVVDTRIQANDLMNAEVGRAS